MCIAEPDCLRLEQIEVSDVAYVYSDRADQTARNCHSRYHERCKCKGHFHWKPLMVKRILTALKNDPRTIMSDDGDFRVLYVPLHVLVPGERVHVAYLRR